jgi:outer membrane protein assembly factor BamD (BamD/ComL family)
VQSSDERLSDLAEQNRFFAEAMIARERGDEQDAARLLDEFILRYPASPLLQDAHVARFRALQRLGDRASCARAARRYLLAYPDGFAVREAQALIADGAMPRTLSP